MKCHMIIFFLILGLCYCFTSNVFAGAPYEDDICIQESLRASDADFCSGGLKVIFPELGDVACSIIPFCHQYRERISHHLGKPKVQLPQANKAKKYVLIMVDPDAPSRNSPTRKFWRHWLVTDIPGSSLLNGLAEGKTLSDYKPPTPQQGTGFHRYQFLVFDQPTDKILQLSPEEEKSLGNWNLEGFIKKFSLGSPLASTQFLTQNSND
ncbi:phosphatidylethanolamine-binding protein 4 [Polypterus senegalus]